MTLDRHIIALPFFRKHFVSGLSVVDREEDEMFGAVIFHSHGVAAIPGKKNMLAEKGH
jgi:hypothetical protein